MDNLDRFNEAVIKAVSNWWNILFFVAAIYVIGTIFALAGGTAVSWIIISWIVIAVMAICSLSFRSKSKAAK